MFYFAVYKHCDLHARREGLRGLSRDEPPPLTGLLKRIYLLSPLLMLIVMLLQGFPPFRAAAAGIAFAILVIIGTTFAHGMFVAPTGIVCAVAGKVNHTIASIYEALHGPVKEMLQIVAICAAAGIVAGVIGLTGAGGRFAALLPDIASGMPLAAMIFAMVLAVVLGMGATTAAYAIGAAAAAPGPIRMGIEPLVAHMFSFYHAVLSAITPPVALASFAAAGLSGGDMWRTGMIAVRFGLATFAVPFMFWLSLAQLGFGTPMQVAQAVGSAPFGVWLLACATEGWMFRRTLPVLLRPIALAAAIMLLVPEGFTDIAGLAIGLGLITLMWQARRERTA